MGGPCFLIEEGTENWKENPKKERAPACTDNFQVRPFEFEGKEWQSVEQCYQAMKYTDPGHQEAIRRETKYPAETDWDYGIRVWQLGQIRNATRLEWPTLKVEYMYKANVAKYLAHPDMQQELLATGEKLMIGSPSTANWRMWNGLIQTRIRKELREGILGKESLSGKELEAALKEPFGKWVAAGLV